MAPYTITYMAALIILIGLIGVTFRLAAVRLNKDPIMRRLNPKSPEYAALKKFQQSRKFFFVLLALLIADVLALIFVIWEARVIANLSIPGAHSLLFFCPAVVVLLLLIIFPIGYHQLLGDQRRK